MEDISHIASTARYASIRWCNVKLLKSRPISVLEQMLQSFRCILCHVLTDYWMLSQPSIGGFHITNQLLCWVRGGAATNSLSLVLYRGISQLLAYWQDNKLYPINHIHSCCFYPFITLVSDHRNLTCTCPSTHGNISKCYTTAAAAMAGGSHGLVLVAFCMCSFGSAAYYTIHKDRNANLVVITRISSTNPTLALFNASSHSSVLIAIWLPDERNDVKVENC